MPEAYKRCVEHVRGSVRNPFAVCTAADAGGIRAYRKREARRRHNPFEPAPVNQRTRDPMAGFFGSYAEGLAEHMARAAEKNSLSYNRSKQCPGSVPDVRL